LPGFRRAHSFDERQAGQEGRAADDRDLARALDQAQRIQLRREVRDREIRESLAELRGEIPGAGGAAVPGIRGKLRHAPQREVAALGRAFRRKEGRVRGQRRAALEGAREVLPEEIGPRDLVHARELPDLLRVFRREHLALAALAPLVSVGQVQDRLSRRAVQDEIGVGHLDAAQVVEVGRLPETRVALGRRSPLEDRDGALADRVREGGPPRREFLGRKVRREEGEPFLGRDGAGQSQCENEKEDSPHGLSPLRSHSRDAEDFASDPTRL